MARNPLPDHSPNRRLGGLEALRGMGAFVVLLHHCGLAFLPFVYFGNPAPRHFAGEAWIHATPLALFVAGHFAVVVFFVLSAFVLSLGFLGADAKDDRDLAAASFKTLWPRAGLLPSLALWRRGDWSAIRGLVPASGEQSHKVVEG
ncbi:MAG: acyltransferase, partial [Verrucomicrobia bacterium]